MTPDHEPATPPLSRPAGLLARQRILALVHTGAVAAAAPIEPTQLQPASLDLRLSGEAYRVRASFLPGQGAGVFERLRSLNPERVSLQGEGAVLEKGIVYIAPLIERLALPAGVSGAANPKSSTGRLDIFTRLIVDGSDAFDAVPESYAGPLWAEISPRSFSVPRARGDAAEPVALPRRRAAHPRRRGATRPPRGHGPGRPAARAARRPDRPCRARRRAGRSGRLSRHQEQRRHRRRPGGGYAAADFWEPILARADRRLVLDPDEFYILASREQMQIPADLAAEMAPIDPAIGEFRVHYAGFFDPGFGQGADGRPAARAVLEVRSRDVPFLLEDGQPVGRLVFEELADAADELYGAGKTSNYQHQGLKLSKHFRG